MKRLSIVVVLSVILAWTLADEATSSSSSEVTKLEVVDLGVVDGQLDSKGSLQLQRKRDSGYVYNRPDRLSGGQRFRGQSQRPIPNGYRAKILSRYPSQSQRPFTSYGAPGSRPSSQYSNPQIGGLGSHQNQLKGQQNHHGQFSNQFNKPGGGFFNQEVPSPVRHFDFVEPNPIASQNDVPFGQNTANYLPPRNQELPSYSAPSSFAFNNQQNFQQQQQQHQSQGSRENFESQGHGQGFNPEISDAANFLAQNAQAISQLYGAPATDQSFAPNNEEFSGQGGQIQGVTGPQNNQHFSGQLPSYASGTLEPEESLERIQSKEKDRLIAQLQTLLSQSRSQNAASAELIGQYAQSHGNYIENQNLLTSLSNQIRDQNRYENQNTNNANPFGSGNAAFGQAPFTPGTSTNPTFTLGYGITTQQTPTSTTTTTTTTTPEAPILPSQGPSQDGSSQTGTSLPAPPSNFPQYGGFVPSLIGGSSFPSGVPSYGTFVPASPQQPAGSSPTHFGIPIPQNPNAPQQPQNPGASAQPPTQNPLLRPIGLPQPVQPVHSIHPVHSVHPITPLAPLPPAVTPLHPVSTTLHGFQQFHGIAAPMQPVHPPVHPVLPVAPALNPVPVHPAPAASQPAYGVQSAVFNPLLYKPVKAVYPIYYYPNLQYQVQKPALPSYPWSYAPSYPQAKPAQIWK